MSGLRLCGSSSIFAMFKIGVFPPDKTFKQALVTGYLGFNSVSLRERSHIYTSFGACLYSILLCHKNLGQFFHVPKPSLKLSRFALPAKIHLMSSS